MDFVAKSFISNYYSLFDNDRDEKIKLLYHKDASLQFEGAQMQGLEPIYNKIKGLPYKTVKHAVGTVDGFMTIGNSLLIVVNGQLKADEDPVRGFNETFLLHQYGNSFFITAQVFRLALHHE